MLRKLMAGAFAAVVLLISTPASAFQTHSHINGVASWLAQRPVTVQCLTEDEAANDFTIMLGADAYVDGFVDRKGGWHPGDWAVFNYGICEGLMALNAGDASSFEIPDLAWYLIVITHESGHLRGHRWSADEAKTQCWAMRHLRYVMPKFGVTTRDAQDLLISWALYWHSRMPVEYQLEGCKLPEVQL